MLALVLAVFLAAQPAPVATPEPRETHCAYMVMRDGRVERSAAPLLHVLQDTARDGAYAPGLPAGAAIQCGRTDIVPAANDWKVIEAGHPFYIVEVSDSPDARMAVLEISQGQVRYRFITGQITEAEVPRMLARLNAFQLHLRR
jgi:hypothetical protein